VLKLLIGAAVLVLAALGVVSAPRAAQTQPQAQPQQQAAAAQVAPTPAADEQSIELSESQLSDALSQRLVGRALGSTPLGPATLERLAVQLRNGQILANGDAQVGGSTVPVTMTGHVDVQDGRPLAVVDDARAAGMPVPQSTRASIQQAVQAQLDQELQRQGLRVRSVAIADGKMTVVGARQR
jgi:hypothetical protein